MTLIWKLRVKIWKSKEWPRDWCRRLFIPLPKKGNLKECANHRTISLIVHDGKVLLKITIANLQIYITQRLANSRQDSRKRRHEGADHKHQGDHGQVQGIQHPTVPVLH